MTTMSQRLIDAIVSNLEEEPEEGDFVEVVVNKEGFTMNVLYYNDEWWMCNLLSEMDDLTDE